MAWTRLGIFVREVLTELTRQRSTANVRFPRGKGVGALP